ncbi:MAG: hypothetical protein ACPLY8_16370, partial [Thermogutta sp.]
MAVSRPIGSHRRPFVRWMNVVVGSFVVLTGVGLAYGQRHMERLDRGFVAVQAAPRAVYLTWRLLREDPQDIAFNVYRQNPNEGASVRLNKDPIIRTCDFVDDGVGPGNHRYILRAVRHGRETGEEASFEVTVGEKARPYLSIRLDGDHTFQKIGIADLDGDGKLDVVIK